MNIGDFLELERSFHGDGVMGATAEEQGMVFVGEAGGQRFDLTIQLKGLCSQCRQVAQRANVSGDKFVGAATFLGQRGSQP